MFGRFLEASHLNGVHQTEYLDHFVGGDCSRVVLVIHPECPPICIKIRTVQIIRKIRQKIWIFHFWPEFLLCVAGAAHVGRDDELLVKKKQNFVFKTQTLKSMPPSPSLSKTRNSWSTNWSPEQPWRFWQSIEDDIHMFHNKHPLTTMYFGWGNKKNLGICCAKCLFHSKIQNTLLLETVVANISFIFSFDIRPFGQSFMKHWARGWNISTVGK